MKFTTIFALAALALGVSARPRPQDEGVPGGEETIDPVDPIDPSETVVDPELPTTASESPSFTIQTSTDVETETVSDSITVSTTSVSTTTSTSLTSLTTTTSSTTRSTTSSTPSVSTNPAATVTAPPPGNGALGLGAGAPNGILAAVAAAAIAAWL